MQPPWGGASCTASQALLADAVVPKYVLPDWLSDNPLLLAGTAARLLFLLAESVQHMHIQVKKKEFWLSKILLDKVKFRLNLLQLLLESLLLCNSNTIIIILIFILHTFYRIKCGLC